jgi:hypothetical protein
MPLWVILFMIALNKIKYALPRLNLFQIIICSFLCLGAIFFAMVMLTIIQDARGLGLGFLNGPDAVMFRKIPFILFFIMIFIVMACILAFSIRKEFLSKHLIPLFTLLLILIQISSSFAAMKYTLTFRPGYQQHGRALSLFVGSKIKKNDEKIIMISDDQHFYDKRLRQSIEFWLPARLRRPFISFISFEDYHAGGRNWPDAVYILTRDYSGDPLYRYSINEQSYYIYDVDSWRQKNSMTQVGKTGRDKLK